MGPGARLGHYEILEPLGAGGMGEVYRARDTRLDRDVALKVLPPEMAADAERRLRFEREAKAIAALDHPNIVTIHSVEEATVAGEGLPILFLTMQLVDGKPLSELIPRQGLALERFFELSTQLADAVSAAHARGITHRDLKPSNVMVTGDGRVKVLDFGLAKLREEPSAAPSTELPTQHVTEEGRILGTVAYMSPEQAEGKPLDHRSDIFSLGIMLYEMASGQAPFRGDTKVSLLSSIVKDVPAPVTEVNRRLPRHLGRIVRRCLEKDPGRRYQSAVDLRNELEDLRDEVESGELGELAVAGLQAVHRGPGSRKRGLLLAFALSVVGLIGIGIGIGLMLDSIPWRTADATPPIAPRDALLTDPPIQLTANPADNPVIAAAISPDGRYLAYTDANGIYLRNVDTGETQPINIVGEYRFWEVSWYPDGTRLVASGVSAADERIGLYRIPIVGGAPAKLADNGWRPQVSPDGSRIAYLDGDWPVTRVWTMGASGEGPRPIVQGGLGDTYWLVTWSRDSRRIVVGRMHLESGSLENGYIESIDLGSDDLGQQQDGPSRENSTEPKGGQATLIYSGPRLFQNWRGVLPFTWLADDRFVFALSEPPPNSADSNLWMLEIDLTTGQPRGEPARLTGLGGVNFRDLFATADGRRFSFLTQRNREDIYVGGIAGEGHALDGIVRLTSDERRDMPTGWSNDNRQLLFASDRGGTLDLYRRPLEDGTSGDSGAVPVVIGPGQERFLRSSPDGFWYLYQDADRLMRVPVGGGSSEEVHVFGRTSDLRASVAFDFRCSAANGRCVLSENVGGELVFFILDPFEGKGEELGRLAVNPAFFVQWDLSHDGRRVAVVNMDNRVEVLDLSTGQVQEVAVDDWTAIEFVAWSADGQALFVNGFSKRGPMLSSSALLRVANDGEVALLRQRTNEWIVWPHASSDGRYIAYGAMVFDSNAWMIEGFRDR